MHRTTRSRQLFTHMVNVESLEQRLLMTVGDPSCEPVVTQNGNVVTIVGQASDDVFELLLGTESHRLEANGFTYDFDAAEVTEINIGGGFGNNSIRVVGSELDDQGSAIGVTSTMTSSAYVARTFSFQNTTIEGGGGNDRGQIYGSNGDDGLQGLPQSSVLTTPESVITAANFERVDAYGRGGNDYGSVYGTQGRDFLVATSGYVRMTGPGITKISRGFERVDSFGRGGNDYGRIFDTPNNDLFVSTPRFSYLRTTDRLSYANGFEEIETSSDLGGVDVAQIFDADLSNETLTLGVDTVTISNADYSASITDYSRHLVESVDGTLETVWPNLQANDIFELTENSFAVRGPNRDDSISGIAAIETPDMDAETSFNLLMAQLAVYLPEATVNQLASRFDAPRNSVLGTAQADDDLLGTVNDDDIEAGAANDVVFAMAGDDLIDLGSGNDTTEADLGDDIGFGGLGNDELKGGNGSDILLGGDGSDIVDGEGGDDFVSGGAGADVFRVISADDQIVIADFHPLQDRIELINMDPADTTLTVQFGSLAITHPDGLLLTLLGVPTDVVLGDLQVDFVTGEEQTFFDPDA